MTKRTFKKSLAQFRKRAAAKLAAVQFNKDDPDLDNELRQTAVNKDVALRFISKYEKHEKEIEVYGEYKKNKPRSMPARARAKYDKLKQLYAA